MMLWFVFYRNIQMLFVNFKTEPLIEKIKQNHFPYTMNWNRNQPQQQKQHKFLWINISYRSTFVRTI